MPLEAEVSFQLRIMFGLVCVISDNDGRSYCISHLTTHEFFAYFLLE